MRNLFRIAAGLSFALLTPAMPLAVESGALTVESLHAYEMNSAWKKKQQDGGAAK